MSWGEELFDDCMTAIAAGSLLAAAMFTPGCVAKPPEPEFTLHITPEVSAHYPHAAKSFKAAAREWCRATEQCVVVRDKSHGAYEVRVTLDGCIHSAPEAVAVQTGRSIYLYQQRCSDMKPIAYRTDSEMCVTGNGEVDVTMFETAAHELGHLLGHKHVNNPDHVMHPDFSCRSKLEFGQ